MRVKKIPHIRRCNNSLHSHVRNHLIVTHTFILITLLSLLFASLLLIPRSLHHTRSLEYFSSLVLALSLNVFIHISKLSWWLILFIVTIVQCTLTDLHVFNDTIPRRTTMTRQRYTSSRWKPIVREIRKWEFEGAFHIPRRFYNYLSRA